jgi:hypothetical protein
LPRLWFGLVEEDDDSGSGGVIEKVVRQEDNAFDPIALHKPLSGLSALTILESMTLWEMSLSGVRNGSGIIQAKGSRTLWFRQMGKFALSEGGPGPVSRREPVRPTGA